MTISLQLLVAPVGAVTASIKDASGSVVQTVALTDNGGLHYSGNEAVLADGEYIVLVSDTVQDIGLGCIVYKDGVEFDGSDEATEAEIHAALDSYANKADYQADLTGLNDISIADVETAIGNQEPIDANIVSVTGTAVTDVDDFKADVSGLETEASAAARAATNQAEHDATQLAIAGITGGTTPADIYTYFTDLNREDAFKADLTGIATTADITATQTALTTEINANETKIDTLTTNVANLNDISIADVETAIGNAEPIDANIVSVTGTAVTDVDDFKADVSGLATPGDITAAQTALTTEINANETKIDTLTTNVSNLNDISIADVETAIGNQEPVDANIVSVTGTAVTDVDDFKADVSGLATPADITAAQTALTTEINANETKIDTIITNIGALNDISIADVQTAIGNAEPIDANIVSVTGTAVTDVDDFKADVSGVATPADVTAALNAYDPPTKAELDTAETNIINAITTAGTSPADIYTYFTDLNREDAFKADLTGIATTTDITSAVTTLTTEINANETKIDTIITNIAGLNDISAADVWTHASRTLTDKTGFELTAAERLAIATQVEQSILDEGDGQAVLNAIVGAIGNQNVDEVALVAAIRADLERPGGCIKLIETKAQADARQALLIAEHDATQLQITNAEATILAAIATAGTSPADIYTYFTDLNREDVFKADLTGIATSTDVTNAVTTLTTEINANETKIDTIITNIAGLNDISITDVETAIGNQAGAIADAVWDEPKADHETIGTMGERVFDTENFSKIAAENTQT